MQITKYGALFGVCFAAIILLFGCVLDASGQPSDGQPASQQNSAVAPSTPKTGGPAPPSYNFIKPGDALVNTSVLKQQTQTQKTIVNVLSSYQYGNESSLDNVNELLKLGPEATADLLELSENSQLYAKWSALYAFSAVAHQTDEAQSLLIAQRLEKMTKEEKDPSMRTLAGSLLLSMGKKEGFDPLLNSLNETGPLFASQPPRAICTWADEALGTYSGQNFAFSCSGQGYDNNAATKWKEWLNENKNSLQWNGTMFVVK